MFTIKNVACPILLILRSRNTQDAIFLPQCKLISLILKLYVVIADVYLEYLLKLSRQVHFLGEWVNRTIKTHHESC